ncbi:hypothetical protein E2C01_090736 [Portunus trituberculatus]|uniref:Uncharacterized protein n=1 Tax=Portunus trituberculatus TaxID=210409 RepID=A0A5B7JFJ0_PORTR|nr:hypothetical protein [Portunus trituberculatus]
MGGEEQRGGSKVRKEVCIGVIGTRGDWKGWIGRTGRVVVVVVVVKDARMWCGAVKEVSVGHDRDEALDGQVRSGRIDRQTDRQTRETKSIER